MRYRNIYMHQWRLLLIVMFLSMFFYFGQEQIYAASQNSTTISGTLGHNDGFQWTYDVGTKTMSVTGEDIGLVGWGYTNYFEAALADYGYEIENIIFKNCKFLDSLSGMLEGSEQLKNVQFINCNTSEVTDMSNMFRGCSSLTELDLSNFDTSNVVYMYGMFSTCSSLMELDLSNFDTSNVVSMNEMFYDCSSLENLNLNSFNTKNVKYMVQMFSDCSKLTTLDLKSFDTSCVESMSYMFYGCSNLKELNLRNFSTTKVTDMYGMFGFCEELSCLDLSNFDTSNIDQNDDIGAFLSNCNELKTIYTPKKIAEGIAIDLPDSYIDTSGNIVTQITSKNCNTELKKIDFYTITYELNGGDNHSDNPNTYKVTSETITLNDPSRKGYEFAGWYSDKAYTNKVTRIQNGSTGNKTFYAKWTAHKYNIKFNGNGADSGTMSTLKNCKYGSKYNLSANKFKRKGYTFTGWNTKKDGSGKTYKNKASVKNLSSKDGKTVTLYAQWKKTKYTITYNLNGGKNNTKNPNKYYVTTSTIKLKNPTRKGYTFKGWYSDKKCTKKVTQIKKGSAGNVKLYAKWVKKK